jgi:tetratricopeptide (TPR) repeat protein
MSAAEFLDQAIVHLKEAVRLQPDNPSYTALLGEALVLRGECQAALPLLMQAAGTAPSPRTFGLLALAMLAENRFEDALSSAEEALRGSPTFKKALEIRAWASFGLGDWQTAASQFGQQLEVAAQDNRSALGMAATIGFSHLAGDADHDPVQMRKWLDRLDDTRLEARDVRFLRDLSGGRETAFTPDQLQALRCRFVHAATRGMLKDLPPVAHAVVDFHLAPRPPLGTSATGGSET